MITEPPWTFTISPETQELIGKLKENNPGLTNTELLRNALRIAEQRNFKKPTITIVEPET